MFILPPPTIAPIEQAAPQLPSDVAKRAQVAVICAASKGQRVDKLAIYDADLPASQKRLWLLDLRDKQKPQLILRDFVAHGAGSDPKRTGWAKRFSNIIESGMTSLGLYKVAEGYEGHSGWSWRLDGLTPGFNTNARDRAVVLHPAKYVTADGAIGRSLGCPAVSQTTAERMRKVGMVNTMLWIDASGQGLEKSSTLSCTAGQQWLASLDAVSKPTSEMQMSLPLEGTTWGVNAWEDDPMSVWGVLPAGLFRR